MPHAVPNADRARAAAPTAGSGVRFRGRQPQWPSQVKPKPGGRPGRPSPPVSACIFSCIASSALRLASLCAVTSRSSRISRSSGLISEGSILTPFTSTFVATRPLTRPPPEMPSTSTWPSSSCIACIFDCSCAACFIMPRKSAINRSLLLVVAVGALSEVFTTSMGFRRLGGKLAHLDHLGTWKSRQHLLHPRIGFGGALALVPYHFVLRAQRRLPGFVGDDHGPAPSGPLLQLAREVVDQRPCRAALQREFEPSVLEADQPDIGFQRGFGQQIALFGGERHQFGKASDPARRRGLGLGRRRDHLWPH